MRLRSRHAWSAVLVALFALPVLKPQGFPGLEGTLDGWLNWTGRLGLGNPHAWRIAPVGGPGTQREKDLEVIALEQRESYYRLLDELVQRQSLRDALAGVERLPVALEARILRAKDASSRRRSILIDRGAADGLVEGLAVVQGSRLVGLIQHVDERSSRVQLVTDAAFRIEVAVRTQEGVARHGVPARRGRRRHAASEPARPRRPRRCAGTTPCSRATATNGSPTGSWWGASRNRTTSGSRRCGT